MQVRELTGMMALQQLMHFQQHGKNTLAENMEKHTRRSRVDPGKFHEAHLYYLFQSRSQTSMSIQPIWVMYLFKDINMSHGLPLSVT